MICYPEMGVALGYDSRRLVSTREMAKYTYLRGSAGSVTRSTLQGPQDSCPAGLIYAPSELARDTLQRGAWIGPNVRASNEALPIDFPHSALRGAARLSFTARIEGAHSDRAASASKKDGLAVPLPPFQARSFSLRDGG